MRDDMMRRMMIAAVMALLVCGVTTAETITVCASGCDYTEINAAIDAASDGDVIQLAAETYYEGVEINTDGKAIVIQGVSVPDEDGPPETVIDGGRMLPRRYVWNGCGKCVGDGGSLRWVVDDQTSTSKSPTGCPVRGIADDLR